MKNVLIIAVSVVLSVVITTTFFGGSETQIIKTKESVFDRVMRTGKIRCGYNTEPPMLDIDPNTGEVFGATVDIVERIGKLMSLDIEWSEQVSWTDMPAGLEADRYDLVCNGKWIFAAQSRGAEFSPPIYYTAVHAYGRDSENRLDDQLSNLNNKDFSVTSMDGEINFFIAHDKFPNAQKLEYPALTSTAELILAVLNKKADVTFLAAFTGNDYIEKNPGKIKQLTKDPIVVFDTALMYKSGESAFGGMLDAAIRQMHSDGFINESLDKYNVSPQETIRVPKPY